MDGHPLIPVDFFEMSNAFINEVKYMNDEELLDRLINEMSLIYPGFANYLATYSVAQLQFPSNDPKVIMSKYCFIAYMTNKIAKIKAINSLAQSLN